MAYTVESLAPPTVGPQNTNQPTQFDLPTKEFIGYDPKGTTTITGSPIAENKGTEPPPNSPESPVDTPEGEVQLSPKLSAIARKEQAQRAREKAIAEKERTFAEKMSDADKYQQLRKKIEAKDYSAIDELGVPYEEIVKHELNKEAAKNPEQERIQQLEEKQKALEKALEDKDVKEYQANQALWKAEILRAVGDNPEFSTIKELKAEDIVLQHINDSFEEDNIELSVEEAAKEIEAALVDRAEKYASVSKIKNRATEGKVLGPPKTGVKTITQNMTTTPKTATSSKPFHLMSESEQIEEARRRVQAARMQR